MIGFINALIQHIANFVKWVLNLLPTSPFVGWAMPPWVDTYWGFVNVFIPFTEMVSVLTTYVVAVAMWYVLRWVLRFLKFIG
jgi:hypothetical protein